MSEMYCVRIPFFHLAEHAEEIYAWVDRHIPSNHPFELVEGKEDCWEFWFGQETDAVYFKLRWYTDER